VTLLLAVLAVAFVTALVRPDGRPLPQRPIVVLLACAVVSIGWLGQRLI
jgi:hypothetical protein